ncbi:uncharacterized protein LOC114951105 isoform X2 [Acropora millepora]|nr:uncharacterized protein LOC114951105 isoform X2 [Acropora millepora]
MQGKRIPACHWKRKKNRNRQCHVYPFNKGEPTTGHAAVRTHTEVKRQAFEVCTNKEAGKKDFAIEGVLGMCWGFAFPHFDVIKGRQLITCIAFVKMDKVSSELISIKPPSELTRRPRKLKDIRDWKASEMKSFLLYYAIPLLYEILPKCYLDHLMLLVGGGHLLLRSSISYQDLNDAGGFLKLFVAQSSTLYGDQFMTYNVHQLLHLKSDVENLGPLWTHSCFFFEDLNGDFRDLFHGTQNINGQILQAVSTLQKLPELAREICSPTAKHLYSHLIDKQ